MKIKENTINIFFHTYRLRVALLIIFFFEILYFFICFISRGQYFNSVFHPNPNDTFADFFKPMYDWWGNPYENPTLAVNYPALAVLFFQGIRHFATAQVTSGLAYRSLSSAWIPFIIYNIFCFFIFTICVFHTLKKLKEADIFLALSVCLLSAFFLYSIERGNIALLAFVLSSFFCCFYENKCGVVKETAYISLAIAAGLKIYPAIFGFLLVRKRRWKDAWRLVGYGIAFFMLPFLHYGLHSVLSFLGGTQAFFDGTQHVISYSIDSLFYIASVIIGRIVPQEVITVIKAFISIALVGYILLAKTDWESMLACGLFMIVIPPTSYGYTLLFLYPSFLMLIRCIGECDVITKENSPQFKRKRYIGFIFLCFSVILVPWASLNITILYWPSTYVVYSMTVWLLTGLVLVQSCRAVAGRILRA